jgi:hypothetical protein
MQVNLRQFNLWYIHNREKFVKCIEKIKSELTNKGTVKIYDENIMKGQPIKTTYLILQQLSDFDNWINTDYPITDGVL